ncbi:PTS system mannose/fructose/sorbose family transporter subunit IID [Lactobacillus sp. DCY120]|uniref:PTS system mannose/fructose/sorbose family transporter subunit IID n=1 Tax=Bombilactobacillus apium TaxID=2675299 RepID=A0A850R637_9LACO|nr:PTS system mannose/fructose/sorbose family transporter subunit IID [Bombilactobacillus apium]NVY96005.1 PTS system mannose/fructose/sorbose family transporter subunit IID [Bombilactobacillus apium]
MTGMNKTESKKQTQADVLTKKDINKAAWRYMFMACNTFNYENQQAPTVAYSLSKALRKIYPHDEDYKKSLNNHFNYFNTTTWMANILLGASLAMEEKDGINSIDAVQNFKTGMMGPLAGIGDTLIWVLYPTIMGSIAAYMGLNGNPTGAIIWLCLNIFFLWVRLRLFHLGYDSGLKLVTTLGDKISVFTEAASIMGLTVIGALIPSVVKMNVALTFQTGKVKMGIQKEVLDKIIPALLPVTLTFIVYKLLASKKMTVIQVIMAIIVVALICAFFGILKP